LSIPIFRLSSLNFSPYSRRPRYNTSSNPLSLHYLGKQLAEMLPVAIIPENGPSFVASPRDVYHSNRIALPVDCRL
jgi:hypothetical protein